MAIRFTGGAGAYLRHESISSITYPFTMTCWAKLDAAGATSRVIMWLGDSSSAVNYFALMYAGSDTFFRALARGTSSVSAIGTTTPSTGVWYHVAAVFTSSTSRTIYTNGGDKVNNTSSVGSITNNRMTFARYDDSTPGSPFDGDIAHAAVYNSALSDGDVLALAEGASPLLVSPGSLEYYWPFDEGQVKPMIGSATQTEGGIMYFEQSMPIARPAPSIVTIAEAAAGVDVNVLAAVEAFTFTTYQASIAFDVDVTTNVEAFTFTTYPATIAIGGDTAISANVAAYTFATYPATITYTTPNVEVSTNLATFTFATYQATIEGTATPVPPSEDPTMRIAIGPYGGILGVVGIE